MFKMRMEIEQRLRELGKFSREAYEEIVEEVLERYRDRGIIAAHKLDTFEEDLKRRYSEAKRRLKAALEDIDDEDADDEEKRS